MKNEFTVLEQCAGVNKLSDMSAKVDYQNGNCELRDCDGIALTSQGKIIAEPDAYGLGTAPDTIASLSGFNRWILQIGTGIYIWNNSTFIPVTYNGEPLEVTGTVKFLHTHLDIRFESAGTVYVLGNLTYEVVESSVGTYRGPATSVTYQKMPAVSNGFLFNNRLYVLDGQFIRYSERWYYDCWDYGNSFIPLLSTALEGASISGLVCVLCSDKVVILKGDGPHNFQYSEFDITPIANSLASGYDSTLGNLLVFAASDGLYAVDQSGNPVNLTSNKLKGINTTCRNAVIKNNEYYKVFTNDGVLTYDFANKALLLSTNDSVISVGKVKGNILVATTSQVCAYEEPKEVQVSISFPFMDFSSSKRKKLRRIRLFGNFKGVFVVKVLGTDGMSYSQNVLCVEEETIIEVTGFGKVTGEYISIVLEFVGSVFELERVRATGCVVN